MTLEQTLHEAVEPIRALAERLDEGAAPQLCELCDWLDKSPQHRFALWLFMVYYFYCFTGTQAEMRRHVNTLVLAMTDGTPNSIH